MLTTSHLNVVIFVRESADELLGSFVTLPGRVRPFLQQILGGQRKRNMRQIGLTEGKQWPFSSVLGLN